MNIHTNVVETQINEFINFIDKICKDPNCIGLTEENKNHLHEAFDTLITTAQNEVIFNIAKYLKTIQNN